LSCFSMLYLRIAIYFLLSVFEAWSVQENVFLPMHPVLLMPFPDVFSIPKQVELKHMKDLKEFKEFLFLPKITAGKNVNQEKQNHALNNLVDLKSIKKAIDVSKLTAICKTVTKIGKFKRMAEATANLTDDPDYSQSASDLISRQKVMEMICNMFEQLQSSDDLLQALMDAFIPDPKNSLQQSDLLGNLMDHLVSAEFVSYVLEGFGKSRNRTVS
ncbi:hypothetical protein T11_12220, partial [Trichinella zimbabwensis]